MSAGDAVNPVAFCAIGLPEDECVFPRCSNEDGVCVYPVEPAVLTDPENDS